MSFGLNAYIKSNVDSIKQLNEVKKETKVESSKTEISDVNKDISTDKTNDPIEESKVASYKEAGDPKMLDFGLFDYKRTNDYKNNPKS